MSDRPEPPALCPSAPAKPGAALFGVVDGSGRILNLPKPLPIDAAFIKQAKEQGSLEQRFRFTTPCQKGQCVHWNENRCALIGQLFESATQEEVVLADKSLPRCSIRPQCRWWTQMGPKACAVCPLVVT